MTVRRAPAALAALAALLAVAGGAEFARAQATRLTIETLDRRDAVPGTVLFVDFADAVRPRLVEVDLDGREVWSLHIPPELRSVRPKHGVNAIDAKPLPGTGTLLLAIPGNGAFEIDRSGRVMWSYRTPRISHDVDRLANGNTLFVWGWDERSDAQVTEVDRSGRVVWEWRAAGRIDDGARRARMPHSEGFTHANGVQRLAGGTTLVSLRNFSRVVEVGPDGAVRREWARLPLVHDPQLLADGTLVAAVHSGRGELMHVVARDRDNRGLWRFRIVARGIQPLPSGGFFLTGLSELVELAADRRVVWRARVAGVTATASERDKGGSRSDAWFYKAYRVPR